MKKQNNPHFFFSFSKIKLKLFSLSIFLVVLTFSSNAQDAKQLHKEISEIINSDPVKAMELSEKQITLTKDNTKEKVDALNDLGNSCYYLDEYSRGTTTLLESIAMAEKISYDLGKAEASVILGNILILEGKFSDALEHFSEGLKIYESLKINNGIAQCNNGLGTINLNQEHYEKALEYFEKALKYGDEVTKSDSYVNMSQIYLKMEAYDDAKKNAEIAFELGKKNDDLYVEASALDVIGKVVSQKGDFKKSTEYFEQALEIKKSLEDNQGIAATMIFLGQNYKNLGNIDTAMILIQEAHTIATEIGANEEVRISLGELAKLYAVIGDFQAAFSHQTRFIEINEAISNDQASKKIAEMEAELQEKIQKDKIALMEKDKEYEKKMFRIFIGVGIFIILMIIIAAGFIYNRYQMKKKAHAVLEQKNQIIEEQKYVLEEQKHVLEEKNTEILDSITYAKRIQTAILPSDKFFNETLPNSFVLYKPKDIIAGDFYWLEETTPLAPSIGGGLGEVSGGMGLVLFAAADCTGHGVPGAMVSVICNNALNRSVREFGLTIPSKILDKTRDVVIEQFEKSESEVKDGMDISLCAINFQQHKLSWSGANNPIWIVRQKTTSLLIASKNNTESITIEPNVIDENYHLFEIKADKQPIGKYADPKPFSNWEIDLTKGDSVYIFTDGYADQFGGDKGKKFMAANMKKLILSIQNESVEMQKKLLDEAFENYRSDHEQIDDVCIIGVRF
jgi:tetratricopeptide (TPR) repeat protein